MAVGKEAGSCGKAVLVAAPMHCNPGSSNDRVAVFETKRRTDVSECATCMLPHRPPGERYRSRNRVLLPASGTEEQDSLILWRKRGQMELTHSIDEFVVFKQSVSSSAD